MAHSRPLWVIRDCSSGAAAGDPRSIGILCRESGYLFSGLWEERGEGRRRETRERKKEKVEERRSYILWKEA